eukprot:m.191108 g.191108  ORF g.191108 m.191108 type:complete len:95 (+) comp18584_c0_seq7:831-1115(+)
MVSPASHVFLGTCIVACNHTGERQRATTSNCVCLNEANPTGEDPFPKGAPSIAHHTPQGTATGVCHHMRTTVQPRSNHRLVALAEYTSGDFLRH